MLLLLLLLFPLLLLAVRCIVGFRNHKMRQLGITPLGRILIIETKAEQISANAFFVLQLQRQNVRQNFVCGRGFPVVGKPFTTVLFPPTILEWSDIVSSPKPHCCSLPVEQWGRASLQWQQNCRCTDPRMIQQVRRVLSLADAQTGRYRRLYSR